MWKRKKNYDKYVPLKNYKYSTTWRNEFLNFPSTTIVTITLTRVPVEWVYDMWNLFHKEKRNQEKSEFREVWKVNKEREKKKNYIHKRERRKKAKKRRRNLK